MGKTVAYRSGKLEPGETEVVREFPLKLIVNRREVATLICSPHDLRFLAAGFLRLQGFVQTVSDFHMLSVCNDFGIANVEIRGDLPDTLKPVLTSGCGDGISFTVNRQTKNRSTQCATSQRTYLPAEIFGMMEQLARLAENYKSHG
ncbi:MAG: sulfurtransferase FdhD, partial [Deltaproteobacteria bacterium]